MTLEEKLRWQKEICNIDKYHKAGYTGKGVTVLCHEDSEHGRRAMEVLRFVAPDVSVIYASVVQKSFKGKLTEFIWNISGKSYSFDEVMNEYKPDIISCSLRSVVHPAGRDETLMPYIDSGELILVTSAGNEGLDGVQAMYNCGLVVGACQFANGNKNDIRIAPYSARTKDSLDVDYVGFMGDWDGTSAATPFVAGQIALFISRYGKVSQKEFQRLIKPYCKDLGEKDKDWIYGDGLIVLPEEEKLKEKTNMFKDVETSRWSYDDIKWALDNNIVNGFEDGTFRPEEFVTREQFCAMLKRMYDLIKK